MQSALRSELERNLKQAKATRKLLHENPDRLQGNVKKRLVLSKFTTDVWNALIAAGNLDSVPATETVADAYAQIVDVNEVITAFNEHGDITAFTPLISRNGDSYGREDLLDVIEELCEEAESALYDATYAVEDSM